MDTSAPPLSSHVENERLSSEWQEARSRIEQVGNSAIGWIREHPGKSVLAALVVGFVVGRIVRS